MYMGLQMINWMNSKFSKAPLSFEDVWAEYPSINGDLLEILRNESIPEDFKTLAERLLSSQVDIVSFSAIGSLLYRPYAQSSDVFAHLSLARNTPDFTAKRIVAERIAKAKVPNGEATLEEIYRELEPPLNTFMDEELKLERQTLQVNLEMLEVFEFAKQAGKTLVINAGYLPAKFVDSVLYQKGIKGYKFIVSADDGRDDFDGSFHKTICRLLNANLSQVIFVEDQRGNVSEEVKAMQIISKNISQAFINSNTPIA